MVYGVWWFPTAVKIRLSQPPAGAWLGLSLATNLSKKIYDNLFHKLAMHRGYVTLCTKSEKKKTLLGAIIVTTRVSLPHNTPNSVEFPHF